MEKIVELPLPKKPTQYFVAGDWHEKELSISSFSILCQHAKLLPYKERNLIINGDFLDLGAFFEKNPNYQQWANRKDGCDNYFIPEYEAEIKWGNDTLDALQSIFKTIIFIHGNHDTPRLSKFLSKNCPIAYKPHFDIDRDLKLEKRGIQVVQYNCWLDFKGSTLSITHGMAHGNSCNKKHYELSGGRDVIFNHVHTFQCFTYGVRGVTRSTWSNGSMADLNPEYIGNKDNSWQNGYITFTMRPNGIFNVYSHVINNNELYLPNGVVLKG